MNDVHVYLYEPMKNKFHTIITPKLWLSWAQKQPSLQDFLTKMKIRISLVPNPDDEMTTKIQLNFIVRKK
jgi:hypothetical protein